MSLTYIESNNRPSFPEKTGSISMTTEAVGFAAFYLHLARNSQRINELQREIPTELANATANSAISAITQYPDITSFTDAFRQKVKPALQSVQDIVTNPNRALDVAIEIEGITADFIIATQSEEIKDEVPNIFGEIDLVTITDESIRQAIETLLSPQDITHESASKIIQEDIIFKEQKTERSVNDVAIDIAKRIRNILDKGNSTYDGIRTIDKYVANALHKQSIKPHGQIIGNDGSKREFTRGQILDMLIKDNNGTASSNKIKKLVEQILSEGGEEK